MYLSFSLFIIPHKVLRKKVSSSQTCCLYLNELHVVDLRLAYLLVDLISPLSFKLGVIVGIRKLKPNCPR